MNELDNTYDIQHIFLKHMRADFLDASDFLCKQQIIYILDASDNFLSAILIVFAASEFFS